jgi:hypothetical protein
MEQLKNKYQILWQKIAWWQTKKKPARIVTRQNVRTSFVQATKFQLKSSHNFHECWRKKFVFFPKMKVVENIVRRLGAAFLRMKPTEIFDFLVKVQHENAPKIASRLHASVVWDGWMAKNTSQI